MKLLNKKPIIIEVVYEPSETGTAITTEVSMEEITNNFTPSALTAQWQEEIRSPLTSSPDGLISINSELNWGCGFNGLRVSSYHLPTMIMRGIARCLGFISSIQRSSNNKFYFFDDQPTVYDQHLFRRNSPLSGISSNSQKIADFVTSNEVYFDTGTKQYPIFSPKEFVDGESLCAFDDDNSLMSASLGEGNIFMNVDQPTIDILNAVGWNLPFENLGIKCLDIDESGIGSSYKSHTFMLAENNLKIDSYKWYFSLKDKNEIYKPISESTSSSLTIERIANPEKYHSNINGDLEGKIECIYTIGGKEYLAEPFKVSLEQKPQIISISDISRKWNNYNFTVDFNVHYAGAEKIDIKIEEEACYNVTTERIYQPFIAHVSTGLISGLYYSWVTVEVTNQYGTTRRTLKFPPFFSGDEQTSDKITTSSKCLMNEDKNIQLFNLQGESVFTGKASDLIPTELPSGIYLRRENTDSGTIKTSKVVIK